MQGETRQRPDLLLELLTGGLERAYHETLKRSQFGPRDQHADNTLVVAVYLPLMPMNTSSYEKYQVPPRLGTTRFSTLSFVLRKAEMAIALTSAEWQWLERHQLSVAIDVISESPRVL